MRAADLVVEHGARIRPCASDDCKRFFVRHKGGLYCSKACSQKVRTARLRLSLEEKGESWSDRRHLTYRRKVEREQGKAVAMKIRRRTRGK